MEACRRVEGNALMIKLIKRLLASYQRAYRRDKELRRLLAEGLCGCKRCKGEEPWP
jgi:hypothetical protein